MKRISVHYSITELAVMLYCNLCCLTCSNPAADSLTIRCKTIYKRVKKLYVISILSL